MAHISRRSFLKGAGVFYVSRWLPSLDFLSDPNALQTLYAAQPERKRVYIAPDDHTDYFWAGDEQDYEQAFLEMLDYYLDYIDETANEPSEFQMRWNCDGSFWLWTYEKRKPEADFLRLIDHIRTGHIQSPLNALVVCLGGAPAEAVLRGMYYAGQLERRYSLRFPVAIAMENQTLPYGLGALWAGSGALYSWKGICGCDSYINARDREHEIYWMENPDGSRILMKWNSMVSDYGNIGMGGYAEARLPEEAIDFVETDEEFLRRYPYSVVGIFGKGWDELKTFTNEFVPAAQNKTNDQRLVIVSNQIDFFEDFQATYGDSLPAVACTFGNEWDLYCAALAEVSASVKRSTERLRTAEALAAFVAMRDPTLLDPHIEERDNAWMSLGLYWEHNFGLVGRFDEYGEARIAWQRRLAQDVGDYVEMIYAEAAAALGSMIPAGGSTTRFCVFNPLSWTRTDYADIAYDSDASDDTPVHVVEIGSDLQVPAQRVTVGEQRFVRILAADVPPLGYRVYEVREGEGSVMADAAAVTDNVIENDFYRLTVAENGAITSLIDKQRGDREFIQEIGGRTANDLGAGTGTIEVESTGPVSTTLRIETDGPLFHTTWITLYPFNRIDIRNEISENFDETMTWAYSFALTTPDVWYEEVGAIIRAKLVDDGGHYAATNARYDWQTLNHFADVSGEEGVGVTLSNADCYFMKVGASTVEALDTATPQISPLAGGHVGGDGGIPSQGGDRFFLQRFALQTHDAFNPVNAMRMALEHQNPLAAVAITGEAAALPETVYSLLELSDPSVVLWAFKPSDDAPERITTRFWNVTAQQQKTTLRLTDAALIEAIQTTHVETPIEPLALDQGALNLSFEPHQLKTVIISKAPNA